MTKKELPVSFKVLDYRVPTITIATDDLGVIRERLLGMINRKPYTFIDLAVCILFHEEETAELNKNSVFEVVRGLQLNPIAVSGVSIEEEIDLPVINVSHFDPAERQQEVSKKEDEAQEENALVHDRIITEPVRSGQRIYSKGNLTVTAAVSSGAEIMAEGSIYVFGPMRGRALAGIHGNTDARIICHQMNAELLSIARVFKLGDQIKEACVGRLSQAFLNEELIVEPI